MIQSTLHLCILLILSQLCINAQVDTLSDEFNRTCNLYNWQNVNETEGWNSSHLEALDVNESTESHLTMMPWTTGWYQNYRSTLLFKEAYGDFVFTTYVTASNRAEDDIPGSAYSLAGAMIRTAKTMTNGSTDWVAGQENYVFLSLGFASTNHGSCPGCLGPHFEVKNTTNSVSNLNISHIDTAAAIIRLVKIDQAIVVLYELANGSFTIRQRYSRPDMPDTLQVGLVTYTDWNKVYTYTEPFLNSHTINADLNPDPSSDPGIPFNPDLIGKFDYARFEQVDIPVQYNGLDFSDPSQVSDSEILNLFAYPSTSSDLSGWKIWNGISSDWNDVMNWSGGSLPSSQDSILIPNCDCSEVQFPELNVGNPSYASLVIENGGTLTIAATASLEINLGGNTESRFINDGTIINEGILNIINTLGRFVENRGLLQCSVNAQCNFID